MKYALFAIIIFSIALVPVHVSNAGTKHERAFKTAKAIIKYEKVKHDVQVQQFYHEYQALTRSVIKVQNKIKHKK